VDEFEGDGGGGVPGLSCRLVMIVGFLREFGNLKFWRKGQVKVKKKF